MWNKMCPESHLILKSQMANGENRKSAEVVDQGEWFEQNCRYFNQFLLLILEVLDAVRQAMNTPSLNVPCMLLTTPN